MKKKHQHFIPKSYLKNFARKTKDDTYLIATYDKFSKSSCDNLSIKDVCVETDIYTLTGLDGDEKYNLENYFSENIENQYPKVYKLLTKDKRKFVSPEERMNILFTTVSLYFRTPKILNQFSEFSAKLIDDISKEVESDSVNFLGYEIDLNESSINKIKKKIKEKGRVEYFKARMALFHKFIEFKMLDGISVIELVGDQEFVTSDNPVQIGSLHVENLDLFDLTNSIYIPLDVKHALFIAPKREEAVLNQIFYTKNNFFQNIMQNHYSFENAERWVLGSEKGIQQFIEDEEKYSKPASPNHPIVTKAKEKLEIMKKFEKLLSKGISNENKDLISFLKNLKGNEIADGSVEIQEHLKTLKKAGLKF
ncbi:DUF4238 domain-containing protein [Marivirga sp.]|uniref:DUF4238 domain-containing protein n=1 Tax=Marivirga sp. TaxID=2018662 RepID=UPI003DA6E94E